MREERNVTLRPSEVELIDAFAERYEITPEQARLKLMSFGQGVFRYHEAGTVLFARGAQPGDLARVDWRFPEDPRQNAQPAVDQAAE